MDYVHTAAPLAVALARSPTHLRRAASGGRRVRPTPARARRRAWRSSRRSRPTISTRAPRAPSAGTRRLRDAAGADARRVRRLARRVPDRVRRDPRHASRAVRRRSVRGLDDPRRGSAPRVRNAGQEPPAAPARELRRVRRPAVATSTALVRESAPAFALLLRRLARLDGVPADTNADLGAYAARRRRSRPRVVGDLLALSASRSASGVDADAALPGLSRRRRAALALRRRLERSAHERRVLPLALALAAVALRDRVAAWPQAQRSRRSRS